jgi:hypothetical protein
MKHKSCRTAVGFVPAIHVLAASRKDVGARACRAWLVTDSNFKQPASRTVIASDSEAIHEAA